MPNNAVKLFRHTYLMEKKHVIRFLNEKRRGCYTMLVAMYADLFPSMSIRMALTVIKEDLEKEPGTSVELHYFSLARAISRFKKKGGMKPGAETEKKWEFKDANEIKNRQLSPGMFTANANKVKQSQDVQ
jgi:hypothetical protein